MSQVLCLLNIWKLSAHNAHRQAHVTFVHLFEMKCIHRWLECYELNLKFKIIFLLILGYLKCH